VAKNSIKFGHHIQVHDTSILAKKSGSMEHIIREVIEIEFHLNNMKRKGFS